MFVYSVVHFGWYSVLAHFLYIHPLQNFFHQVTLYQQAILTANGLFWLKTLFWLFGLCSFQVLTCLAWLVWREYSRDWRASMQVFLWRVARRVKDATLTRQIDNSRTKLARVCEFFPCELCSFQLCSTAIMNESKIVQREFVSQKLSTQNITRASPSPEADK